MKNSRTTIFAIFLMIISIFSYSETNRDINDYAIFLTFDDLEKINQGLSKEKYVLTIPTGAKAAPSGCPNANSNHCIWMCTGQDPLDDIDENSCSTNTWKCNGCGTDGGAVCQDGDGNSVPCNTTQGSAASCGITAEEDCNSRLEDVETISYNNGICIWTCKSFTTSTREN